MLIQTTHLQLKKWNAAHALKRTKTTLPGSESISFWYLFFLKKWNVAHALKRTKNTLPGSESISFWYLFLILEESPYTVDFLLTLWKKILL